MYHAISRDFAVSKAPRFFVKLTLYETGTVSKAKSALRDLTT